MFEGSLTALITPFAQGAVALERLREQVEFQIAGGTSGLVPVGTTGEAPTLTADEKDSVIRTVVEAARGRVPVIAGTGTNDTRGTIEATKRAQELGADAVLVVTPYYNKPSQEGLFRHFEAVAASVRIPVCLYNVPGRTGVNLLPETVARLARIGNIQAVKEASGQAEQGAQIVAETRLRVLSGDDAMTLPLMAAGARGVISVASNLVPKAVAGLCAAAARGDLERARDLHLRHLALWKALFLEPNPVPVKTAMKWAGRDSGEVRLPLCEMAPATQERLRAVLAALPPV